jgi:hypothetical protein
MAAADAEPEALEVGLHLADPLPAAEHLAALRPLPLRILGERNPKDPLEPGLVGGRVGHRGAQSTSRADRYGP